MRHRMVILISAAASVVLAVAAAYAQTSLADRAAETMRKAARFYRFEVSTNGGYLFEYTTDMKHRYGEMPARESQIWVQDPSTPGCGQTYLNAYEATGDPLFLEAAQAAARALIRGQMDFGGWNYLIDFRAGDMDDWYTHEGHHPDFNEFSHFEGNATFDDGVVKGPIMLLLRLYDLTNDPSLLPPLEKALDFVLEAQYPNGGWPQRYPTRGTGYDSCCTYNDGVINNNIELLVAAYAVLTHPKYLEGALRGADYILLSRHASPQYGWGYQYTLDMKLAWGRILEPPSLTPDATVENIRTLMDIYELTGDRRYIEPIPSSLDWLDRSKMPDGSIGRFLEEGTNRPMSAYYEGDSGTYESIRITYDLKKAMEGYGFVIPDFSTEPERKRYAALISTPWKSPLDKPGRKPSAGVVVPDWMMRKWFPAKNHPVLPHAEALARAGAIEKTVEAIIASLDDCGRWTEDGRLYTERFYFKNAPEYSGPVIKNGWIRTSTFIRNMNTLAEYTAIMKRPAPGR